MIISPCVTLTGHRSQESNSHLSGDPLSSYLYANPITPSLDHAFPKSRSHKRDEKQPVFNLPIPELGTGILATVKTCAAWAVLLASHGCKAKLGIFVPGKGGFIGPLDISINWTSLIGDLTRQVKAKLGDSLLDVSDTASSSSSSTSNEERDYEQTFRIIIPSDQSGSGAFLLECHARDGRVSVRAIDYDYPSGHSLLPHLFRQYEYIIRQICLPDSAEKPLVDLRAISVQDLKQIWAWNAQVPQGIDDVCIHEAFMERARQHPELLAVSAHDGKLTYRELDKFSTQLANALIHGGVKPRSTIVVFIEKSMWVPVAQIAVMKCGCASTVLDASLPFQRQQSIADLVQPSAILTSPGCEEQATKLGLERPLFILDRHLSQQWPSAQPSSLPKVSPSDWMYIVFTSGSTGTPKGAIISHANYASAVATQQSGLDFREFDRVFDFASYAFDASWCNLIHALMIGGCLCIPSDEERKGDIVGALRKYQVNYAVLTPSVAWFPASELPASLRTIHFGGEPLRASLVKELSTRSTVINAYGPAECSTVSTAIIADPNDDTDPTIGTGLGACTWVVKLDGTDLVPIGDIGELWLEGPIIGQGYLRDPEKTFTTFVESPSWLIRGFPDLLGIKEHAGRRGRLYRTGDLVRYRTDGKLKFVGRKDSQVKIRGQRVELGEIEYNLQRALTEEARAENVQIIAEVIKPGGSSAPTLVSFLFMAVSSGVLSADVKPIINRALLEIEERLAKFSPPYMIPAAFFVVEEVPMTPTGKVDRRRLREDGARMYWQQLNAQSAPQGEEIESKIEAKLRKVWSEILNLPLSKIGLDSAFTRLGGDSISAMQVVSRCRSQNISIKVADILKFQTVRKIGQSSKPVQEKVDLNSVCTDEGGVWPLTPIQRIFFDDNPQGINHYTLSYIVKLARLTTHQELLAALLAITGRHGMLRARFRKSADGSTWEQYIAPAGSSSFLLKQHDFVDRLTMQLVTDARQASLDLANGPVFAVDVFNSPREPQTLLMSAHHAMMDLVSWRIVWHELSQYLSGTKELPPVDISFQTWCRLQREEGGRLDPDIVLPFEIVPANFEYWGVTPEEMVFEDSTLNLSTINAEATALLLGTSNDCFRTEILDILVGTLVFCFNQVFPDRRPPAVFLEGHGRESVAGMDDSYLSEVIGWFTSIYPIQLDVGPENSVFDTIKFSKDIRKRVPGKGRPYFACRFYSEAGRKAFDAHKHVEIIFNYRGSFQQLEDTKSMFKLEDREDRNLSIPGEGLNYQRPSLVDMNLVVQEGRLQIWTRSHKYMRNHEAVVRWIHLYAKTLDSVAHELASSPARYTLTDFPLLDISYAGLEKLTTKQLASEGIKEAVIRDIYPCTPMQEGILISSNIGTASYHTVSIWQAVSAGSAVSVSRLVEAWETVSRTHPVFSTVFSTNPDSGRFVQVVLIDSNEAIVCQAAGSETAVEHLKWIKSFESLPSQPQCLFTICIGSGGEVACRLDMSHALMDALSFPIIVRDLETAYSGQTLTLSTPFCNYVEYIQSTPASNRLLYWKEYLAGVKTCNLPGDMPPTPSKSQRNGSYGWITLPTVITAPIARVCREKGLTRSAFLHLAWSLVLSYFTGMRQVCFGYISSGRDSPVNGIEYIVGPLINMLIARIDLGQPLSDVMDSINKYNIEHLENQHISLAEVQHEISSKQLFNTNITVREARRSSDVNGESMELVEISEEDPHEYDLVLSANLDKDNTEVRIQYRTDFTTFSNARAVQAALESAINFLGSVEQHDTPAAASHAKFCDSLYDAYFYHTVGGDERSTLEQWKAQFRGIDAGCHFPPLPPTTLKPSSNTLASFKIDDLQWRNDFNVATQIIASWALLQACYGGSADVLIGACLSGDEYRGTGDAMPRPLRLRVDLNQRISSYLDSVQSTAASWLELPRLAMHRLRGLGDESSLACDFQTILDLEGPSAKVGGQIPDTDSNTSRALYVYFDISATGARLTAKFDEDVISAVQITRLFSQLATVLRQICSLANSSSTLTEVDTISDHDLQAISTWNATPYEDVQGLVHDLISQTARAMPDSLAVSSWDGELTYRQLDRLSTRLAYRLVQLGVGPEVIVPLYFEKSKWVPVSAIAVMKAGGAGVMIDCTQPIERASGIISQVKATLALVSSDNMEQAAHFEGLRLLVIDRASMDAFSDPEEGYSLPRQVQPSNLIYVSFTSGSTGKPKGAMITHSCFSSSIKHQQTALGFRAGQRVYDFASYAFDASWSNLLHSLTSGSCLCIPSEHQRRNALSDSIRDSRATLLNATPSVLRHLDPKELPELEQVLMGGEAWSEADFVNWIDNTKLINSYGPGECTIKTCLIRAVRGMVPNTLGVGIGLNTWIVRTDGSDRLAPLGSIGELWLEGPQVGRGYIGDEGRTAASFVTRPKWTQENRQQSRFYRTGDLVRYGQDGALIFVSRKDSQVKIRGQRTELGEVEHGIRRALFASNLKAQIIADVFKPHNSDNPVLVAFLKSEEPAPWHRLAGVDERLAKLVPDYMIPSTYIALQEFPMTATGKIHRRALRETYEKMTLEQLVAQDAFRVSGRRAPSTASEKLLRDLWAEILGVNPATISADDSFLRIGGDSLGAMRLVGAARKLNIELSVADIFRQPRLNALAETIAAQKPSFLLLESNIEPFSLLDKKISLEEARDQAAHLCDLETTDVEDIFPCTNLQAGLLAETVQHPGDYVLTETWNFRKDVDVSRFRAAWQKVVQANPILRTRIVDLAQQGLVQVIVRYERCGIEAVSTRNFSLGTPLVSYEILESSFSWSIHHAIYDGWSAPLIFDCLVKAYRSEPIQDAPPFQAFIRYLKGCNQAEAEEFWKSQFRDFNAQKFPVLPSRTYKPRCDQRLKLDIKDIVLGGDYTVATKIRLAWAILLSTITNSPDASFGTIVSGRQANVPGIETLTGPTIATVPLRVAIDRSKTIKDLLQQVQMQAADMMSFEQFGIQKIRRINEDCNLGCQFQSLMAVQPGGEHSAQDALFESSTVQNEDDNTDPFKLYAICLEFVLKPNIICLRANYDSTVVPPSQFRRLADRFENILRQISLPEVQPKTLSLLNTSSSRDLKQIWSWNNTSPEISNQTIHELFGEIASRQPGAPAVCSWDGDFTYSQVDDISTRIAHELLRAGLPQSGYRIVPLFFEKSKWTSVCQIAVMKANGTSVALDVALPDGRLRTVMGLAKTQIILTSAEQEPRARELAPPAARVIVVGDTQEPDFKLPEDPCLPAVDPRTPLYIVFTSGSTGTPKGVIINHSNFASALKHGLEVMKFGPDTRTYDFVSYAFDVSWLNVLYTLCAGGCLCIPSQYEIQNEPRESVARRRANTAVLTPTVGKLLHGTQLKLMNFGGENLGRDEIHYWKDRALIFHSYGPSECTPISVSHILDPTRSRVVIGKGLGARTWVVEPERGNSLTAVGDVGELWLEGPLVGQGYLHDPEKTNAVFVEDPEWLIQGGPGFAGRRGRLYRTGDLVRYEEDGSLEFIGRKDAQIKIRGQRVELEEIEHHILDTIGEATVSRVVVDIIKPADSGESALIAFVKLTRKTVVSGTSEAQVYARKLATSTNDRLSAKIPSYMIPNGYMIMDDIPYTTSGKVDRGKLRQAALVIRKEDLLQIDRVGRRAPKTPEERKLHTIIARVLSWEGEFFGMDSNFIQLGGDSISAMRLASIARGEGIYLTVADILTKGQIADLLVARPRETVADIEREQARFGLLGLSDPEVFIKQEVMPRIQSGCGKLVDVLPATDLQSAYLRDNLHAPRRSWFYSYIDFTQSLDEHRLIQSCEKLVDYCDIYRTAFVRSGDSFFQAIFDSWKPSIDIIEGVPSVETAFDNFIKGEVKLPALLGDPLVHFKLIRGDAGTARLVFSMSHAVYDAISLGQTLQILAAIYNGLAPEVKGFRDYVSHTQSRKADSYSYWRNMLENSSMTIIPCALTAPARDGPPTVLTKSIPIPKAPPGITQASLFTLACASALSRLTGSPDVVFGRVVSGRAAVPAVLQNVVGPCLNRVPVRVQNITGQTKTERLVALQRQYVNSLPHETTGLSDIARHCVAASGWQRETRDFGCWTQYQNVDEQPVLDLPGTLGGLRGREMWDVLPVTADFLEIFAIPSIDGDGTLTVRIIAGPGYAMNVITELLGEVCSELVDTF